MKQLFLAGAALLLLAQSVAAESWEKVNVVFQQRCIMCHSGDGAPLDLRLDSHEGAMRGSENGPVIFPGDPDKSRLMHRLTGAAEPRMPMNGPPFLEEEVITMIGQWIQSGAKGAGSVTAPSPSPDDQVAPGHKATMRAPDPRTDGRVTYAEVAPIFGKHCVECHSHNSRLGSPPEGLRLASLEEILRGGDRLVVVPGNAQASEIIRRVQGLSAPRMPLDGPPWLGKEEVALLRDWIDGGALDDDGNRAPVPAGATIRLRGILTAASEIDGTAFRLTPTTEQRKAPAIGVAAELRGYISPDGTIIAERLRQR